MRLRPFLLSVLVLYAASVGGARAVPVIVNGGFETTSLKASAQMTTTNVSSWSTSGYNFLFFPGTATTTGAASVQYGQLYLGGSTTAGASNYFPASSPNGGNPAEGGGSSSTPAFHHWHHTLDGHINKNYAAMLPWLDRIFGTFHLPPRQWPARYGAAAPVGATLGEQLLQPLLPPDPRPPIRRDPAADGAR